MPQETITIKPGEFSSKIAQRGGFSVQDLIKANPNYRGFVSDPTGGTIFAGDTLNLPVIPNIPDPKPVNEPEPTMPAEPGKLDVPNLPGNSTDLGSVIESITKLYDLSGGNNTAEKKQDSLFEGVESRLKKLEGRDAFELEKEEELGVPKIEKEIQELTNELMQLGLEEQTTRLKIAQEPISGVAIRGRNIEMERNNAIKALTLSAQIQAKQGNLQIAENQVKRAVDLKYAPIENELNTKLTLYELNKDRLSRSDKKRGEIMSAAWQFQLDQVKYNREKEKTISDYAMAAAKNGAPNSVIAKIQDAGTPEEALRIVSEGGFLQSPIDKLDILLKQAQLNKVRKETELLGEPSQKEIEEQEAKMRNAKTSIQVARDKIDAINLLIDSSGLDSRVGPNPLVRKSPTTGTGFFGGISNLIKGTKNLITGSVMDDVTGAGDKFAGGVHKIVSGLTLDALIEAKARGATFGALSNQELTVLANSASAINDWEIKDKDGKGTGVWDIDQETFKKELESIQKLSRRALELSEGDILDEDEQSLLDSIFESSSPGDFYK